MADDAVVLEEVAGIAGVEEVVVAAAAAEVSMTGKVSDTRLIGFRILPGLLRRL